MPIKIVPKNKPKKFKDLSSGQPTVSSVRTGRTTSGIAWTSPTDSIYKMKKDGTKVDYLTKSHGKQWNKKKLARAKSGVDYKDTISYGTKDQTLKSVTGPNWKKAKIKVEAGGKYYNTGGKVSKNWSSCGANIITGRD